MTSVKLSVVGNHLFLNYLMSLVTVLFLSVCVCASPRLAVKTSSYPFTFYIREDWKASPSTGERPLPLPVPYVVIHHTYIPAACYTKDDCAMKMRSMQTYHKSLDWGDIGYNFCVGSEGGAYEGRGWDRVGIHASKANNHSIGICLIGDWLVNLPPTTQLETTKALIAEGVKLGKVCPDYKLIGHKQVTKTQCPGDALFAEISTWEHFVSGNSDFKELTSSTAQNKCGTSN